MVQAAGGHAVIEWAPLAVKERVAGLGRAGPTARIMKGIKAQLDPRGILNPGRFVAEASERMAHGPRRRSSPPPAGPLTLHGHERRGRQPLRALRPLPRLLPDVLRARHRDGLAARPHLPDQVPRRGPHRPHATRRSQHLVLCLGCRACETVCPSGVPYGQLIEAARRRSSDSARAGWCAALFRWVNFVVLLAASAPAVARRGGAALLPGERAAARWSARSGLAPPAARHRSPRGSRLLPAMPARGRPRRRCPRSRPPRARAARRVGAATGCIQQVAFGPQNRATARVLARERLRGRGAARAVLLRRAPRARRRARATALDLAKRTIEAFEAAGVDAVVVNTSGCGAHMKAYGTLLADDPAWRERAARFAAARARHLRVPRARAAARAARARSRAP